MIQLISKLFQKIKGADKKYKIIGAIGIIGTLIGVVFTVVKYRRFYTGMMALIMAANSVLFSDANIEEVDCKCAWEVRTEGTTSVTKTEDTSELDSYTTGSSGLIGDTPIQQVWYYLLGKGFKDYQAAGIMGNFAVESGYATNNLQNSYETNGVTDESYTEAVNNKTMSKDEFMNDNAAYGLGQWKWYTRKQGLYEVTIEKGIPIDDMKAQLDFVWYEMTIGGYDDDILNASTMEEACNIFLREFEGAGNYSSELVNRMVKAQEAYDVCTTQLPPLSEVSSDSSSTGSSTETIKGATNSTDASSAETPGTPSGLWPSLITDVEKHTGEWTKLKADVGKAPLEGDKVTFEIDKFKNLNSIGGTVRYMQNKSGGTLVGSFSTLIYNNGSNFPDSGCGVCAAAIVMSTLSGRIVNPAEVALAGMTYGDRNSGKSASTIFSSNATNVITDNGMYLLFQEAGFKSELKPLTQTDVDNCLSQNGMVIAVFKGQGFSAGNSGHYIVIREKSEDKYYLVQSAGFDLENTGFDFSTIQEKVTAGAHPEVLYVYPNFSSLGTSSGSSSTTVETTIKGAKYILYHTGDENCPHHNGYYCSCGLTAALDIRKEYVLYEADLEKIIDKTASDGESIPNIKLISNITPISQDEIGYPTGCEITSLTILLNYLGFDITVEEIDDKYLTKGTLDATDPNKAFVGKPTDENAYGCYSPVIVETANKYLQTQDTDLKAEDVSGTALDNLLKNYVAKDNPVVIWVTQNLQASEPGNTWEADGQIIQWKRYEHCVLLVGYDYEKRTVSVADPLKGNIVEYDMDLFNTRYVEMGSMAVVIPKAIGNSKFTEFVWPMKDKDWVVNDSFTSNGRPGHGALDLDRRGDSNCLIVAMYDGEVVYAQFKKNGYGYQVVLKHNFDGETLYTKYNHMGSVTVSVGDIVKGGEQIGVVGGTGNSQTTNDYAIHLDLQMYTDFSISNVNKNLVNPACVMLGLVDKVSDLSVFSRSSNTATVKCTKKGTDYNYAIKKFGTYSGMSWNTFISYYK